MKMKNGSKKTKIFITSVMMCLIFMAFGPLEDVPNLINSNDPFIELDSIGDAIGNAKEAYEKAHPTPIPTQIPVVTPEVTPEPTPTEIPPNENEIQLIVGDANLSGSGEVILLEGAQINSSEDLRNLITGSDYEGKTVLLIDYYAENEAFRSVKNILDETGISYRIDTREIISSENIE